MAKGILSDDRFGEKEIPIDFREEFNKGNKADSVGSKILKVLSSPVDFVAKLGRLQFEASKDANDRLKEKISTSYDNRLNLVTKSLPVIKGNKSIDELKKELKELYDSDFIKDDRQYRALINNYFYHFKNKHLPNFQKEIAKTGKMPKDVVKYFDDYEAFRNSNKYKNPYAAKYTRPDLTLPSSRDKKQDGGLLSDDREKFVFGASALAKMINNLIRKSPKNKQSDTGAFVRPLNIDRLIGAYPEELKKLSSSELNAIRKETVSEIKEYKTDPSPNARSDQRLEELNFMEEFLEDIEVEQYLRKNPTVKRADALEEIRFRNAEQEAEDLGIEAAEIAMEKAERAKKQDGGLLNPEKADLDNDGKLSSYEETRGKAIEENMRESKQVGGMMMDDQMADMMETKETSDMDNQIADMMPEEKTEEQKAIEKAQAPDEMMEENYVDFLIDEALSDDEEAMLMQELQANPQLSMLFDKVMEVAMEFSGSGPVEGPGTEVSDSIPARLSDGEFVFTAKSVDVLGADNLMSLMKQAEAQADQRQMAQEGGLMEEEETAMPVQQEPVRQDIRVTKETVGSQASVQEKDDLVGDELKKQMLSGRPHVRS